MNGFVVYVAAAGLFSRRGPHPITYFLNSIVSFLELSFTTLRRTADVIHGLLHVVF